ncbi:MAG: carboxypeptidase-like regulatory domain-containing protein, partial [Chitinophaga rupis]
MKLTTFLLLATCLQLAAKEGYAQKITLSQRNVSLRTIFREIERQSDYQFFYKEKLLKETKNVSIRVSNASIEEVLAIALNDQSLSWSRVDKIIVIKKQPSVEEQHLETPPPPVFLPVTGVILSDSTGQPLSGVSVRLKGTSVGTYTGADGSFNLQIPESGGTLIISSIGFESQEFRVTSTTTSIHARLKVSATKLNEIVIVGY